MFVSGNSGNNLIELSNALWVSKVLNSTLVLPTWMNTILKPFDLKILHKAFCIIITVNSVKKNTLYGNDSLDNNINFNPLIQSIALDVKKGHIIHEITSEESFFPYILYKNESKYKNILPKYDKELIKDISKHYLRVFCSFWSSPVIEILQATDYFIANYLDNSFNYTAVHKRSLEGILYSYMCVYSLSIVLINTYICRHTHMYIIYACILTYICVRHSHIYGIRTRSSQD